MKQAATFLSSHAAAIWWALCSALLFTAAWCFSEDAGLSEKSFLSVRLLKTTADVAVIMLPYVFLPRRWRGSALIPLWGVSIMLAVNSLYLRFTGDCMPPGLAGQIFNIDTPLVHSVIALLRPADSVYLIVPLCASLVWCFRPVRRAVCCGAAFSLRARIAAAVAAVSLVVPAQIAYSNAFARIFYYYNGRVMSLRESTDMRLFHREPGFRSIHSSSLRHSGIVAYMLTELYDAIDASRSIKLSDSERASIDRFLLHRAEPACVSDKNLIFIIVESLNSEAIGRSVGEEHVTPTLDSLISAPGTTAFLNVNPQVRDGISADGQLIYNLGTLPLLSGAATQSAIYGKKLPTLAAQLAPTHYPIAVFAESGTTWKERDAYRAYGYRRALTSDSIARSIDIRATGADAAAMTYALQQIDSLPQPFFMQILTYSTHYPFAEPAAADFLSAGEVSGKERAYLRYLRCLRHFDSALSALIQGLRTRGMIENTVLVIASDHHMNMDSGLSPVRPIAFIAANSGITLHSTKEVCQVDIFPTVLDIMGLRPAWRGVGTSLYDNAHGTPEEGRERCMQRAAAVSDSILRSDYFR